MFFCKNLSCKMYHRTKKHRQLCFFCSFFSQGTNNYEQLNPCVQFELQAHDAEVQAHIRNKTQGKAQLPRTEPGPLQNLWFQIQRNYLCKQCIFISPTTSKHQGYLH